MTRKIEEIEQILREKKLPDQNTSHMKPHIWRHILERHREQKADPFLFRIRPWIWTAGSLIILALCLFLMWYIKKSGAF